MSWLQEYQPSRAAAWDRSAAGFLLRRAGFLPEVAELQRALDDGPAATVEKLLSDAPDSDRVRELDEAGEALALRDNIESLRGWWLLRMCHTSHPLRARLALFWHGHFATSYAKVRSAALMLKQLHTFEAQALGRFEALVTAVARDPAMIVWLDGDLNTKGRPNENFARELFELFMLGVGNYSEQDIREAARAFTGWHQRQGAFYFVEREHDDGLKTVFAEQGAFDGADVIRVALRRPACARFLAIRLLREFLCPDPPEELVTEFAAHLQSVEFDLRRGLQRLFSSAAFFDPRWRRARILSPAEFVVGVVRALKLRVPAARLANAVTQMGQRLFEPPSVAGWPGHREWLNAATMLVRLNAASSAVDGEHKVDAAAFCKTHGLSDATGAREFAARLLLHDDVSPALRAQLGSLNGGAEDALRAALRTILCSPEFQMA